MKTTSLGLLGLAAVANGSLWVDEAPDYLRPYAIERYANAQALTIGAQTFRFYVTGPSSNGTMTLLSTNAYGSRSLGVIPHIHLTHHENFYCNKGQFGVWTDKYNSSQGRIMSIGDFATVPTNTTHTYQTLSPDSEIGGIIVPGGFEDLFFFLATANVSYATQSPFDPVYVSDAAGSGSSATLISDLESYDVYAELTFVPNRDFINGTAPPHEIWHDGNNTIPDVAGEPYYIASEWGPKYINGETGSWQIIQPFVTPVTGEGDFTQGTITLSRQLSNVTVPQYTLSNHTALQVQEGSMVVQIADETAQLLQGDVAFIPGGTEFSYRSVAAFTKVLYVCAGADGLDQVLLKDASDWEYAVFPVDWP